MKKRILVDMDGVLADVYSRFFELHEEETGQRLSVREIAGLLEAEAFPEQLKWVTTPGFFRTVPVMPGSIEGLKKLNKNFTVIVISLATEFPQSLTDKQLWLHDHFPFIGWQQIVFCGDKNIIKAFKPLEKMSPKQADDTPAWVTEGTSEAKAPAKPSL